MRCEWCGGRIYETVEKVVQVCGDPVCGACVEIMRFHERNFLSYGRRGGPRVRRVRLHASEELDCQQDDTSDYGVCQ